jgi:predicted N-formylglutamate amidohydrolase
MEGPIRHTLAREGEDVQKNAPVVEPWIAHGEPQPFATVNPHGKSRAILACDHASDYIPSRLGNLGLGPEDRKRHIAWDIGAAEVAHALSSHLDAPLILSGYSRLVVDCNRPLNVPDAFAELSEDTSIPGNIGISVAEKTERASTFFWPYHDALHQLIESRLRNSTLPVLVGVHSFTPVYRGVSRPWHVGVHYRLDARAAIVALAALRRDPQLTVGENEPYKVTLDGDYTAPVHAERRGMPYVLFEIRQDLIASTTGAQAWARRLAEVLRLVLDQKSLNSLAAPARDVFEPRYKIGVAP